jgi:two-component system, OmpR family, response regulator BaeR
MTSAKLVYIVEDDAKIAQVVADYLARDGYATRVFHDGRSVVASVRRDQPSAIILDLMLPVSDGVAICSQLREFSAVPILMLTARVDERAKLEGLNCGADDYVTKPFSVAELVARVNALIRRAEGRLTKRPQEQPYFVDEAGRRVAWHGQWLDLSPSEYRILSAMLKQPGRVFGRGQLLDQMGDHAADTTDRAVDSHIKNLRRKMAEVDPASRCIVSVYGSGYRFDFGTN